jgi:hypothetical protein
MSASVLPVLVGGFVSAEETRSMPMPPVAFGLIAFCFFLLGLGVLWTFRNAANKIPPPGVHNDDEIHG